MSFIWPWVLLTLIALPACVYLYIRLQRQRKMATARLGALSGMSERIAIIPNKRRHVPPLLFLLVAVILVVASARPQLTFPVPRLQGTIMLVMDVSSSMAANDVEPSRLEAAKLAAKSIVENRPDGAEIGVVAFGRSGLVVQPPTSNIDALNDTIDRLEPDSGTSLGRGMVAALSSISSSTTADGSESAQESIAPAVILLLTDGENTDPPDPFDIAQLAIERGVRVNTVGIGTEEGTIIQVEGFSLFTQLDPLILQEIALQTEGIYFSLQELEDGPAIYEQMEKEFTVETEEVEVTAFLGGAGALLLLTGGVLSLAWFGRMP